MIAQEPTFEVLLETIRKNTCDSTLEIKREFNEEMIMQIAIAIPENSNLLSLALHPRFLLGVEVISTTATKALINAIITRTSLESLDLGFHLEKGGAEAIAILLQHSTTLRALYLGSVDALPIGGGVRLEGHTSIGDTGVVVLAKALNQNPKSSLDTFCLRHNWFGKEGAETLANALCKIPSFKNLTLLHCMMRSKGAIGLAPLFQRSKTLEDVNLFDNDIGDEGVVALINALKQNQNSSLKIWNLGRNEIHETGLIALATFLKHNPPLEDLCLNGNEFHTRAAKGLVSPFFENIIAYIIMLIVASLGVIGLIPITYAFPSHASYIQLIGQVIICISTPFIVNSAFTSIQKRRRSNIEKKELAEAATEIAALANALTLNNILKILDLSSTDIRDVEAIEFAKALDPSNPNQQSTLESLNLMFTSVGDNGATAFARILPRNRSLETLNLADNTIGSPGGKAFLEALTHDSIWNTPLLNISLGRTLRGVFRGPDQIDKQTKQSIDSILQRKRDISQRQTVLWSATSFCIAFGRANYISAIKECALDLVPTIGKYMGFLFTPRLRQTNPTIFASENPEATNEPPSSELRRRKNHSRK